MPQRCGKKRRVNNSEAFQPLKDPARKQVESEIDETIRHYNLNSDDTVSLTEDGLIWGDQQPGFSAEDLQSTGWFKGKTGLFLTEDNESLPIFGPAGDIEKVWARTTAKDPVSKREGPAGSRIVLTKDNFGSRASGLGGSGFYVCEAIDIVAGSLTCEKELKTSSCLSRANFATDGSRIYLTERGNIQAYFGLGEASEAVSISSELKSGIGIKSDHTLLIGREMVRIVAGLGNFEGGERLVNGNDTFRPRIEIAANNAEIVEPAVLGHKLKKEFGYIKDEFLKVFQKIQDIESKLLAHKYALASDFHQGAGLGAITTFPDPQLIANAMEGLVSPKDGALNATRGNVIDAMKQEIHHLGANGISVMEGGNFINPTDDSGYLSNTVFIGK